MRLALPAILLFAAFVPAGAAQDDGCTQTNPCLLDVEVDADGIAEVSVTAFTSGDWYTLHVSNLDSVDHTVSIEGHDAAVEAEGDFFAESAAFQIGAPATYDLRDQPTGDKAPLTVTAGDSLGGSDGSGDDNGAGSGSGLGIPGLPMSLVVAALAASALVVGRRR